MRKLYLVAGIAAAALAGAAHADDRGAVPGVDVDANIDANLTMPMADKNSDGKVSRSEAANNQTLSQAFDKYDANKDGNLDKGEFAKFEASQKGSMGKRDRGEPQTGTDRPGTTDDSVPGNQDKLGPGR